MKSHILNSPSLIEYKGVKFLIFDAPTDVTLDNYIKVGVEAFPSKTLLIFTLGI